MEGGRVTITLEAECPAYTYSETFVRGGMLDAVESLTAVSGQFIDLGVGNKCDTPLGSEGAAFTRLMFTVSCATASHVTFVEKQARKIDDAQSASFLLNINVISTPIIAVDCPACERVRNIHVGAIVGMVLGLLAFALVVFCIARRVYKQRGVASPIFSSFLGTTPPITATNASPYVPPSS